MTASPRRKKPAGKDSSGAHWNRAQRDLAAHGQPLLIRLNPNVQIIFCEGECSAVEEKPGPANHRGSRAHRGTSFCLIPPCRTISYKTTPAATDNSGRHFAKHGNRNHKSHLRRTDHASPSPHRRARARNPCCSRASHRIVRRVHPSDNPKILGF